MTNQRLILCTHQNHAALISFTYQPSDAVIE